MKWILRASIVTIIYVYPTVITETCLLKYSSKVWSHLLSGIYMLNHRH